MKSKAFILGAGISGCTIASKLKEVYDVVLIDKNDYIGGLCHTTWYDGIPQEFGVHIWYCKNKEHEKFIEQYISEMNWQDYYVKLSVDGTLKEESLFDFPCSVDNINRLGDVAHEADSNKPITNLKEFFVHHVGYKAYQAFFENYNRKQWGKNPEDISAHWLQNRPLKLRTDNKLMFGDYLAGYPQDGYNQMFNKLTEGCMKLLDTTIINSTRDVDKNTITMLDTTKGHIHIGDNDIIISTIPCNVIALGNAEYVDLNIVLATIPYSDKYTPTYSTTFPNHYQFTRIIDYRKVWGSEESLKSCTLLGFDFPMPYGDTFFNQEYLAKKFLLEQYGIKNASVKTLSEKDVYPKPTIKNEQEFDITLSNLAQRKNLYLAGRQGLFNYISMSNAVEQGLKLADKILSNQLSTSEEKLEYYRQVRSDAW